MPQHRPDPTVVARLRAAGCVFAEEEAALLGAEASDAADLERMVTVRETGVPLEQVVGWADFCGLRIVVRPGVFVPRRRTTLLVRRAVELLGPGQVLVDLGCGTGAIAAAVLAAVPGLEVYAVDIDPAAVDCARQNLPPDRVLEGDLYAALPGRLLGRIDVLVANAPYVPTEAIALMPPEARTHEHRIALDGGRDGLAVQRRVFSGAPRWLAVGGRVVVETSRAQARKTAAAMADAGLVADTVRDDELDATAVVGCRPG